MEQVFASRAALPLPTARLGTIVLALAIPLILSALAVGAAPNHDESQYVAAAALMRDGLPFLDFSYLQTPLQPLLFAPLAWLPAGWMLLGHRLANALCAAAAALLVVGIVRRQGGSARAALLAGLLMAGSDCFLFAGTVARNDALPLLLFIGALGASLAVASGRGGSAAAAAAGMLAAAAASAKISYAPPAAALGAMLLVGRHLAPPRLMAFTLGGLAGLLPSLILAAFAWEAFRFGVLDYSLEAPQQWRVLTGKWVMLTPTDKLGRLLGFALLGAPLAALLLVGWDRLRRGTGEHAALTLLDPVIAAALVAAYLPDPSFRQYLVPVLPALFLRLGLTFDRQRWLRGPLLVVLVALSLTAGLTRTGREAVQSWREGSPVLAAAADADVIANAVPAGRIATLAPERVAGIGLALDPRFAAGPFLFRTHGALADRVEAITGALTDESAAAGLDARPPAALLIGTEPQPYRGEPRGLDGILARWAHDNGYRPVPLPSGMTLLVAPERARRR